MAWSFDESNDEVQLTDNAAITFPSDSWTIAGWIYLDDNTGSAYQYWLSWGGFSASPSFNMFVGEDDVANPPVVDKIWVIAEDSVGNYFDIRSSTTFGNTLGAWQHVAFRVSGNTPTVWLDGSNDTGDNNSSGTVGEINRADAFFIGSRSDEDANRRLGGDLAEWAKWDRALSSAEIGALADGFAPSHFQDSMTWYISMIREYQELSVPLTVTNDGSIASSHPPIIYPTSKQMRWFSSVAAAELVQDLIQPGIIPFAR